MTPEQRSRLEIDRQLVQCGWVVQSFRDMNISAGPGVAVREFPLKSGYADYLLYADCKALGVVEATKEIEVNSEHQTITVRGIVRPAEQKIGVVASTGHRPRIVRVEENRGETICVRPDHSGT